MPILNRHLARAGTGVSALIFMALLIATCSIAAHAATASGVFSTVAGAQFDHNDHDSNGQWSLSKAIDDPDATPYDNFGPFARMIEHHWDGIASYCDPDNKVSLGLVEGLNNKIRVLQCRACSYREETYLKLKIIAAFLPPLPRTSEYDPH